MKATATAFSGELPRIRHGNEGLIDTMMTVHSYVSMVGRKQRVHAVAGVGGTEKVWTNIEWK